MEASRTEGLSDRQVKAIPYFLACTTLTQGCKDAGISITQFYEWQKKPAFKEELERQRSEVIECAVNRLKCGMTKATDALINLLDSENETVRRGAANDILSHTAKFTELFDIEQRLTALEGLNQ